MSHHFECQELRRDHLPDTHLLINSCMTGEHRERISLRLEDGVKSAVEGYGPISNGKRGKERVYMSTRDNVAVQLVRPGEKSSVYVPRSQDVVRPSPI